MIVDRDAGVHVGVGAVAARHCPSAVRGAADRRCRAAQPCSRVAQAAQRVVDRLGTRPGRRPCRRPRVGREIEEDQRQFALRAGHFAQLHQARDAGRQRAARSGLGCMSRERSGAASRERPPNSIGPVAPSSSGIATIMVVSTGSRPCRTQPIARGSGTRWRAQRHRAHRARPASPRPPGRRCRQARRPAKSRSARPAHR